MIYNNVWNICRKWLINNEALGQEKYFSKVKFTPNLPARHQNHPFQSFGLLMSWHMILRKVNTLKNDIVYWSTFLLLTGSSSDVKFWIDSPSYRRWLILRHWLLVWWLSFNDFLLLLATCVKDLKKEDYFIQFLSSLSEML